MRRVLLVQPSLQPPGGGNGVAAWVLQALAGEHQVTVLSWEPVDIDPINRFFGTSLRRGDFDTIEVPRAWRTILSRLPVPASLLTLSLLMRHARAVSRGYDVVFGTQNEMDFGRRGIQYVHFPTYFRPRPQIDLRWYHRPRRALDWYYRCADAIADFSVERMRQNLTLVNSDWTGEQIAASLGVQTRTLYPPVVDPEPGAPWDERSADFLAIGRIAPEKDYERVMNILARVRETFPDLELTIVGTWDRYTKRYMASVRAHADRLGPWITFRHDVSRGDVRRLMATHRYGIHGMREEHFGMAPAEMARAGCIVWVPRGGGQMEAVGREPALMFDSDDDAVAKIVRTMADEQEQGRLREVLATTERFSTAHFIEQVRDIVGTFKE